MVPRIRSILSISGESPQMDLWWESFVFYIVASSGHVFSSEWVFYFSAHATISLEGVVALFASTVAWKYAASGRHYRRRRCLHACN